MADSDMHFFKKINAYSKYSKENFLCEEGKGSQRKTESIHPHGIWSSDLNIGFMSPLRL